MGIIDDAMADEEEMNAIMKKLGGKNCGLCGMKTCGDFAAIVLKNPDAINRCPYVVVENKCVACPASATCLATDLAQNPAMDMFKPIIWKDNLGRDYDFVLDRMPGDIGPREHIVLFNPTNVEKLHLKKGDIIFGRPAWISCGCPLTHAGVIVEDPDYFNGTLVWNVVGPMAARKGGINIGYYNSTAYEGIVKNIRPGLELKIGMRHFFQPRYCMLQWRHSGIINQMSKTNDGFHIRIEGLIIG
jgi:uncharacterized Fe-S cluster-containing protein